MTSFFLLIVSVVFILLVMLTVLKGLKAVNTLMHIRWASKHIFIVVVGYIAIGFGAFLYLSLFYKPEVTALSDEEIQQLEQAKKDAQSYYEKNDSAFLSENFERENWHFTFEGDHLPITMNDNNLGVYYETRIRYTDEIAHGNVNITYYEFPDIIEGLDVAGEMTPPNIYMSEQQLIIEEAQERSVRYNRANPSLGIIDFNRETHDMFGSMGYTRPSVILIEVSRSTDVEDVQGRLEVIN